MCKSTETKLVFGNQNNDPTKQKERRQNKNKHTTQSFATKTGEDPEEF